MAILITVGVGLRLWQYLGRPDLWLDELAIANNVITRPVWVLLTAPLADDQVAPPGFLLVTRMLVTLLGSGEYALRAFPLLCSLAALPVLAWIARRVLEPPAAVLSVAFFSVSPGVALYAAEAKPYASDVLFTLVLTALALRWIEAPTRRRNVSLAMVGVVAVVFSHPVVFVLAGLGTTLLLLAPRAERTSVVTLILLWGAGCGLSILYARSRMNPGLAAYMTWFWRNGFMPWPLAHPSDLLWPVTAVRSLFDLLLEYRWPTLYLVLAGLGLVVLLRRRRDAGLLLALPVVLALLAAVVRGYPFLNRLVLFVVPALLLFLAEGIWRLAGLVHQPVLRSLVLLAAALPPLVGVVRQPPVWRRDEVRSVLSELERQRRPGDVVYVSYASWQTLRYYGPRHGLPLASLDVGNCYADPRDYLRELDRYRGRDRVWVLFTFDAPALGERPVMLEYLDAIGIRRAALEGLPTTRPGTTSIRQRLVSRARSIAYLYDLTDPARLSSSSAESREVPPGVQFPGVPRCVHGPTIPHVATVPRVTTR